MPPPDLYPPDPLQAHQAEQLFSLKEWMVAISNKLDRMEVKLDSKADLQAVIGLESRVNLLEKQHIEGAATAAYLVPQHSRLLEDVGTLKQKAEAIASVEVYRRWLWGSAFTSFAAVIVSVVALLKL